MFEWKKHGRVFNPQKAKKTVWMHEFAQAPSTLMFDNFVRVYFSCKPLPDSRGQYLSRSGFVDLDRNNLFEIINVSESPILELGDLGCFDEFGTHSTSVIRDGKNVYVYYAGWTRCESVPFNVAIGLGISHDDGVTFKKYGKGSVLSYTPDEPFILSGPKIRKFNGLLYLWYSAGRKWIIADGRPEPVYKIRMASSVDGVNWRKLNKDLIESRIEEDEVQASPDVIFCNGKYHMFFCYRYGSNYRSKERGYRIGYAFSDNMLDWTRDDCEAGIDISHEGWDSEMVSDPHVFELDGNIYMFYVGNQFGRYGFGLAQLEGKLI